MTDWIRENQEYVTDITQKFDYKSKTKILDCLEDKGIPSKKVTFQYVDEDKIPEIKNKLKDGDLIFFTARSSGLDVGHMGIIKTKNKEITLIHASSTKGKVTENDLLDYIQNIRKFYGVIIARPK